tara:strand:+ start:137 stop:1405 length:1269 start_codon:yes stop_codon:yes gene_type:complete
MVHSWKQALLNYFQPKLILILLLGFSSGLPYGMLIDPLNFWLSESEISRAAIGLLSLITLTYSFKAIWAPFVDRLQIPFIYLLGQRKSWLVFSQLFISLTLFGMALTDPSQSLLPLVIFALATGFASATQDICVDALRIEMVQEKELGEATAMYQAGWRGAFLVSQVVSFFVASFFDWSTAYILAALIIIVISIILFFTLSEPERVIKPYISVFSDPTGWFLDSYISPFNDFISRYKNNFILIILIVIFYRFSDIILGPMAMPFYREAGFSKEEVATITNAFGILVTIFGAFAGGLLIYRNGIKKILIVGALLVCVTNLMFAFLETRGHDLLFLSLTIALDNFSQGVASTVLIAYLSSITSQTFTATQYSLLFLLATVPAKLISAFSGFVVDEVGYFNFFLYASLMGLPAIFLSLKVSSSKE